MEYFFQLISMFALFFGIAGVVYAMELSKRCQQIIGDRMDIAETQLARKLHKQDQAIGDALQEIRRILNQAEESERIHQREINALRKAVEPLVEKQEKERRARHIDSPPKPADIMKEFA